MSAVGANLDVAGGEVTSVVQQWGFVNQRLMLAVGDLVQSHSHEENAMATGSSWFFINEIPVCREGDAAACGDTLVATELWFLIS